MQLALVVHDRRRLRQSSHSLAGLIDRRKSSGRASFTDRLLVSNQCLVDLTTRSAFLQQRTQCIASLDALVSEQSLGIRTTLGFVDAMNESSQQTLGCNQLLAILLQGLDCSLEILDHDLGRFVLLVNVFEILELADGVLSLHSPVTRLNQESLNGLDSCFMLPLGFAELSTKSLVLLTQLLHDSGGLSFCDIVCLGHGNLLQITQCLVGHEICGGVKTWKC